MRIRATGAALGSGVFGEHATVYNTLSECGPILTLAPPRK
jgi:hypothetical protein